MDKSRQANHDKRIMTGESPLANHAWNKNGSINSTEITMEFFYVSGSQYYEPSLCGNLNQSV